ncbi:hypothetical protein ACFYOV_12625 [Streptomyces sp. NPDC005931]|uniref:hypothetical protein n=1 Tax=Streptomyces sp. NPDC005931 TaxID=3364737 RepID=UPI003680CD1A
MLRHEFQPGRLVIGTFLTLAAVLYAGDARGAWDTPWPVMIPLLAGGLFLAGAAAFTASRIRRRRRRTPGHGESAADAIP